MQNHEFQITLGEIASFRRGVSYKGSELAESEADGTPMINLKSFTKEGKYRPEGIKFHNGIIREKDLIKPDEIILANTDLTKEGDILGAAVMLPVDLQQEDIIGSHHTTILKINDERVNPSFLTRIINSTKIRIEIKRYRRGATVKGITSKDLKNIVIRIPPLKEQKRITAILAKADEIRKSVQNIQNIRSKLIDSIFFDMFGDPVINPNNYKFLNLVGLMSDGFQNGLYIPKNKYVDSGGVEMVHMSDAFYDIVQRGDLKQALLKDSEITKYNLSSNNLLITRRSLNYEGAAKSCRIPQSNTPLVFESSLIKLTPDEKVVNPTFLHFYINNKRVREAYVYKFVTQSTISGINQKNLSQIPVMLPPIELQYKFMQNVEFLQQIPDSMELSISNLASINQEMLT